MELRIQLARLAELCEPIERKRLETLVRDAGEYILAVAKMETAKANTAGRSGNDYRDAVESLDRSRTHAHNALIDSVNISNRICDKHNVPRLYQGDEQRRHYGDFAFALVQDIFENRN